MHKHVCCYKESHRVISLDTVPLWLGMRGYLLCCAICQFYGYNLLNWIPGWSTDTSEWWGKFLEMGNFIHVSENQVNSYVFFFLLENPHKLWYLFQLQFNYKKCASFCKQSHANTTNPYNTLCHSSPHLSSISCS